MTKCLLKKDFFGADHYDLQIRRESDKKKDFRLKENIMQPLIEICLPFQEMKQIVDGMIDEDNKVLQLEYPCIDNYLNIRIPEDSKGLADKIATVTTLQLETFGANHNLLTDQLLRQEDIVANVFGKIVHFKKALKEFAYMADKEVIQLRFSEQYPKISLMNATDHYQRNHIVKFNDKVDDLIYKVLTDCCGQ